MKSLTILQLNDSHAYFEAHQELFRAGAHAEYQIAGGYARISTIFNQIRQKREALAFDCGDTIHGTYAAVKTRSIYYDRIFQRSQTAFVIRPPW